MTQYWPVMSRRRSTIMCRPRVVGMSRPSSKDRFPKWKRRWWVCSHAVHAVALGSIAKSPGAADWKECIVGKRWGGSWGAEVILQQGHWRKIGQCQLLQAKAICGMTHLLQCKYVYILSDGTFWVLKIKMCNVWRWFFSLNVNLLLISDNLWNGRMAGWYFKHYQICSHHYRSWML